jgi:hypothetical protein
MMDCGFMAILPRKKGRLMTGVWVGKHGSPSIVFERSFSPSAQYDTPRYIFNQYQFTECSSSQPSTYSATASSSFLVHQSKLCRCLKARGGAETGACITMDSDPRLRVRKCQRLETEIDPYHAHRAARDKRPKRNIVECMDVLQPCAEVGLRLRMTVSHMTSSYHSEGSLGHSGLTAARLCKRS